jgi:hypothetical protein
MDTLISSMMSNKTSFCMYLHPCLRQGMLVNKPFPTPSATIFLPVTADATAVAQEGGAMADVNAFFRVTNGYPLSNNWLEKKIT